MNIVELHSVTCICHSNHAVDSWSGLLLRQSLVWQKIAHRWYVICYWPDLG